MKRFSTSKKNILAFLLLVTVLVPVSVFALDLGSGLAEDTATKAGYGEATETTLAANIGFLIQVALSFVGTIFLVLVVYGGILWMTARGDEGQVDKAKQMIQQAVIGLVITVGAYSITAFVVPKIVERASGDRPGVSGGANACDLRYSDCIDRCDNGQVNVGEIYERCVNTCEEEKETCQ